MSESKRPSIFKDCKISMDTCHVKGVMPFNNIDQDLFKKYYSPSAISMDLMLEAVGVLESFYGKNLIDKGNAKIFFPRETIDPILIIYDVPMWSDGEWSSKETAPYSMCIAIAPRARLSDEKVDEFPMLADLEMKNTKGEVGLT